MIGLIDQRIVTLDELGRGIVVGKRGEVRVVEPDIRASGANVGGKLMRVPVMKIADGSGEHDDVAGCEAAFQNELSHVESRGIRVPHVAVPEDETLQ
jgi:hypothetical protein